MCTQLKDYKVSTLDTDDSKISNTKEHNSRNPSYNQKQQQKILTKCDMLSQYKGPTPQQVTNKVFNSL